MQTPAIAPPIHPNGDSSLPALPLELGLDPPVPVVPAAVLGTTAAVAAGLATIGAATTATAVNHAACALARRLPGVRGVAVLRRDDRGLLGVAYSPIGAALPAVLLTAAGAALHQRWIAAHGPDAPEHGLGPFNAAGLPDLLVVPFARDDALFGALVIAGTEGRPPAATKAERITAAAIGVVAAQALDAVCLRQRLDLAISRSEHEAALARERRRISHTLHEGPTQELALAGITLDRLIVALGATPTGAPVATDAEQARELIDRAIHGMRATLTTLRTPDARTPSVTGPLRELLAELEQEPDPDSPELEVDFSQVSGVHLAPEVERALVGIVREALHNVRKHADADSIQLEVRRDAHGVEVGVVDDGVGFDGMGQAGHFGLEQIRELAEGTGGRVEIGSLPGIGTSVRAWIPLPGAPPTDETSLAWAEALTLDWGEAPGPRGTTPQAR